MQADRIRGVVSARPQTATHLVLVTHDLGGDEKDVACWAVGELSEDLGTNVATVTEAGQEHADDHGKGKYSLYWVAVENGGRRILKRKSFVFASSEGSAVDEATRAAGQAYPADAPSQAVVFTQSIRHFENMHRLYVGSMDSVIKAQKDVITELAKQNQELLRRVRNVQTQVLDAEGKAPQAEGVEDLARAAAIEKVADFVVEHFGPLLVKKIVAAGGNSHGTAQEVAA